MKNLIFFITCFIFINTCISQSFTNIDKLLKSEKKYYFGDYVINLIQYKRLGTEQEDNPHYCTSDIYILHNDTLVDNIIFKDIEPLGWYFGVFLPKTQELKDHFLMFKFGDYDCRTLIIDSKGKIHNIGGGDYSLYKNQYIISRYHQDSITNLNIFDIVKNRIIFSINKTGELGNLYLYNSDLYFQWKEYERISDRKWETHELYFKIDLNLGSTELIPPSKNIFNQNNIYKIDFSNIDLSYDNCCQ